MIVLRTNIVKVGIEFHRGLLFFPFYLHIVFTQSWTMWRLTVHREIQKNISQHSTVKGAQPVSLKRWGPKLSHDTQLSIVER